MNNTDLYNIAKAMSKHDNVAIMMVFHLLDLVVRHLELVRRQSEVPVFITPNAFHNHYWGYRTEAANEIKSSMPAAKRAIESLLTRAKDWRKTSRDNFSWLQPYGVFEKDVGSVFDSHFESYCRASEVSPNTGAWDNIRAAVGFCRGTWLNSDNKKYKWLKELRSRMANSSEIQALLNLRVCFIPAWALGNEDYLMEVVQKEAGNHYLDEAKHRYKLGALISLVDLAAEIRTAEKPEWVRLLDTETKRSREIFDREKSKADAEKEKRIAEAAKVYFKVLKGGGWPAVVLVLLTVAVIVAKIAGVI